MSAHTAPLSRTAGGIHEEEFSVISEGLQTSVQPYAAASPLVSANAKEDVEALLTNEIGKLEVMIRFHATAARDQSGKNRENEIESDVFRMGRDDSI